MNILIVDDVATNQKLLRVQLEAEGHEVLEASNGVEALALLAGADVDAVISDILMPGMDGYRLCYEIRAHERLQRLPLIFYTATYTSQGDEKLAHEIGADIFIKKPASFSEILRGLKDATSLRRNRATNRRPASETLGALKEYSECLIAKLEEKNVELGERTEALRALSARMERVREEESTRIAREIHDVLGHFLTGLRMELRSLEKGMAAIGEQPVREALAEKVQSANQLTLATIDAVKKIATDLRPVVLDHLGLAAALDYEAREFQKRSGINCVISLPDTAPGLDRDRATALYRIFQEILTNVGRHSQATQVQVRLICQEDQVIVVVEDNGKGITEAQALNTRSLGVLGMRERALMAGGELRIQGEQGRGTIVTVQFPLQRTLVSAPSEL